MRCPSHERSAAHQARNLLASKLPNPRSQTCQSHRARAGHIAEAIWRRWQVGPYQARLEHMRWYLQNKTDHHSPGTRYRHWLTVRLMVLCLGHAGNWLDRLDGPWIRPTGRPGSLKPGRPMLEPDYDES